MRGWLGRKADEEQVHEERRADEWKVHRGWGIRKADELNVQPEGRTRVDKWEVRECR